ncbi:MAG TPA: hypothetical protein VN428_14125, partial [Bryobacteraceae bacterium]|nr:hypothetical protein [Bryobacteraceae bacterium]HWR52244.1 hypothetical protein [Bryobacteraceae bacterium]
MRLLIAFLLVPLAWGAAFTSKADGNWNSAGQTTWTQTGIPGAGDTITITHTITCEAGQACTV